MTDLFSSYQLGKLTLKNRAAMAPMTRSRATGAVPTPEMVRYYAQRAGVGLIVTEGTIISPEGCGWFDSPGIWSDAQVTAWAPVVQAVHDQGAAIFAQIWHVGRASHTSLQPGGKPPQSATSQTAEGARTFVQNPDGTQGFVPMSQPQALTTDEIPVVVEAYADAAENAIKAGFDGVEIHGANGYLIEQFLNANVNDRTDDYGAQTIENRLRFAIAVVDACVARVGADKVAIRLSPFGRVNALTPFDGEAETYLALVEALEARKLAYLHLMDQLVGGARVMPEGFLAQVRAGWTGALILAGGLDLRKADALLQAGLIDIAAFGVPLTSNPDLVERFRHGWPLTPSDRATLYGGDVRGYTDWLPYSAHP
ncbi:alkene reductase [Ketogulonicigenium robustum]|nr:alkene reductase [Ketogulonicigenium robustum]